MAHTLSLREKLNLAEYGRTNLRELIPPESGLLYEYLEDIKLVGRMALEIGPGAGYDVALLLEKDFTVHAVDLRQEVLDVLQENLRKKGFRQSNRFKALAQDVLNYQPEECHYSYVGLSHVLHFMTLPEAQTILCRLLPGLKPGGMMMIRVHSDQHPLAQNEGVLGDCKHFFKRADFDWLSERGMEVVHDAHIEHTSSLRARRKRAEAAGDKVEKSAAKGAHLELLFRKTVSIVDDPRPAMKGIVEAQGILAGRALAQLRDAFHGDTKEQLEKEIGCVHAKLVITAVGTTLIQHQGSEAYETRVVFRSSLDANRTGYVRLIVGLDLKHRDDSLVVD